MNQHILRKPITFGDLSPESLIYIIEPETGMIRETKVRSIKVLYRNGRVSVLQLEIYRITNIATITTEKLELAQAEYNSKIAWTIRVLNHVLMGLVTLPPSKVPTVISPDLNFLKKWMQQTGSTIGKTPTILIPGNFH